MPAESSSNSHHRHAHRKRTARLFLGGIAILLIAANAVFFWFALGVYCPWKLLPGFLLGQALGSALLIAGVWRRMGWARFVLAGLLFFTIGLISLCALTIVSKPEYKNQASFIGLASGIALMIAAVTWLIRSRRIRYLATPPGSGG